MGVDGAMLRGNVTANGGMGSIKGDNSRLEEIEVVNKWDVRTIVANLEIIGHFLDSRKRWIVLHSILKHDALKSVRKLVSVRNKFMVEANLFSPVQQISMSSATPSTITISNKGDVRK